MKRFILALLLLALPAAALAQSTAPSAVVGYLSTSGCSYGLTVCFVQYGSTVPVSGSLTPSGTQDVNVKNVGGTTVVTGGVSGSLGVGGLGTAGTPAGGIVSVQGVASGTPIPVSDNPAVNTPAAGTASTITTGGTAVTIVTGPIKGGYIVNPINLAAQGIAAAENAYCDPVASPGSTDANGNGTTAILTPGAPFYIPALATGILVKCNAATSGHKLTVVVW